MKKILLSISACIAMGISSHAQTIMSQDFSGTATPGMPTGWTVAHTGAGNGWQTTTAATDFYFGTASNLGSHSEYAVLDDYGTAGNNPATLTSPVFSLAGAATPYLSYDAVYFEASLSASPYTHEAAWVEFTTDGSTWNFLDSIAPDGDWTTKIIALPTSTSTTCQVRFQYTDHGASLLGTAVDQISVFNAQANDVALLSVTPISGDPQGDYILSGSTATFGGVMRNMSTSTITGFNAYYSVAGGTPVPTVITGVSIASMASYTFTCTTPYTVATLGSQPVLVGIQPLTGTDPDNTNDSMSTAINGVSFMPTKKVLCEEGTGIWCGFCVRGIIYMDSLWKNHPTTTNIIAVHDKLNGTDGLAGENTTTVNYDNFVSSNIGGYPSVLYDRRYSDDPQNAFYYYNALTNNYFGFADMTVTATITGTTINASATVKPATNLSGDYRLAMVVTEDEVHGTTTAFAQHNYYGIGGAYNSTALYGVGYNFNDSPQVIPAASMYYKFVDRYTLPDFVASPNGIATSLPATMTAGTVYPYTFATVTKAATWNAAKLRIVVMMIDNNPNNFTYGMVLNSINYSAPVGTTNLNAGVEGMRIFPNPSANEAHITFDLQTAGNVQFSIIDAAGRPVYTSASEHMNAGGQQLNFSVSNLSAGMYNVVVTTATGTVTEKLTVIK